MSEQVADPEPRRGLGWRIGWTLAGLVPFAAVSAVQLATKFSDDAPLDAVTKALEMPALGLAVGAALGASRRRPRRVVAALLFAGLAASWVGDVALNTSLALGLGAFLTAHAAYIAMFELAFRPRRPSWWALLTIPWFVGLLLVLAGDLGAMLTLVAVYGVVLGLMAASSTRGNALTVSGAVLFLLSDSLLAFRLFTPLFPGDGAEFLVMLAYLLAQALIAAGVVRAASDDQSRVSRTSGSPVSSSIVS